jgi:CHASE3 domain sensor protein
VVALLTLNFLTTGEVTLVPTTPLAAHARAVDRLEDRFVTAAHEYTQAERSAGLTGMDTTSQAQAALEELNRIEAELKNLLAGNPAADERAKIEEILARIDKVRKS